MRKARGEGSKEGKEEKEGMVIARALNFCGAGRCVQVPSVQGS
jgi:hypothetical protein